MKVCLLNDSFPPVIDGVANVVMNYAGILQQQGMADVLVGTPEYPGTDYSVYPYRVIPYQSFDTTKIVKGYRTGNPFVMEEMKDMVDFGPDIIHSHCPVSSTVLARILRSRTDAPLIFTYHTKFDVDIARAVKSRFIQKTAIEALVSNIEACDEVWVVSHGAGENLRSLGFEGDYRVVNNGVDFAKGKADDAQVAGATAGYDLPLGVPVFLFVGRIIKYKGLPLILDALSKLSRAGQDFRMVFVGSGPDEKELKEKAQEYGIMGDADSQTPGACIFTGPIYDRNQLRAWNTRADLFLFPSTYDTNGIVVREAAACGLASVLVEGSCAAEGITHDRNGFIMEENAESLFALLQSLCKDMPHIHQVGQNAMDEIYISWDESVHAAYDRYQQIIDEKKSGCLAKKKMMMTERFKEFSAGLYEEAQQMLQVPKHMFEGMLDNVEELGEEITEEIKEELKKLL
jgi:glycosyltransferase involved in cell wall biosynthesis